MTIFLVGGGSGGHITPLIAVAKSLDKSDETIDIRIVSEVNGRFNHILNDFPQAKHSTIFAGKLRRYHGESWLVRIFDIKRNLLNLRDLIFLTVGFFQSLILIFRTKPTIIFIKGGYVGVPMGFAARLFKIPYITHDSDANAGLTNRIIGGSADLNLVGIKDGEYPYKKNKTIFVGVPIDKSFTDSYDKNEAKKKLGIPSDSTVILVTGGSNGAQRVDSAFAFVASQLLSQYPKLYIIHQIGLDNEQLYKSLDEDLKKRVTVAKFLKPMSDYSAAADLIIARAGATSIAEFAAQAKACILIPNPDLTGGHQLKNAEVLRSSGAAVVIDEIKAIGHPEELISEIKKLLDQPDLRKKMGHKLQEILPSDATKKIVDMLDRYLKGNR